MRKSSLEFLSVVVSLLMPSATFAQVCSGQGTAVCTNPPGSQTITNLLNVKSLEAVRYCDQFPGADIGAQCNNAIADLPSTGGLVEIPAGQYTFTTGINMNKDNVWLRGQGTGTRLTFTGTGAAITLFKDPNHQAADPATFRHVTDLWLSHSPSSQRSEGTIGVLVKPEVQVGNTIERAKIIGFSRQIQWGEVNGYSAYDGSIRDVDLPLEKDQVGIDMHAAHSVTIDSSWIHGLWNSTTDLPIGVAIARSAAARIVNCNVEGNTGGNIFIDTSVSGDGFGSSDIAIENNYFEIWGYDARDITIGSGAEMVRVSGNRFVLTGRLDQPAAGNSIQIQDGAKQPMNSANLFVWFTPTTAPAIENLNTAADARIIISGNRCSGGCSLGYVISPPTGVAYLRDDVAGQLATSSRVGAGTISPLWPLDVKGGSTDLLAARISQSNSSGFGLQIVPGNDGNYALAVLNAGQTALRHELLGNGDAHLAVGAGTVGINTSSPSGAHKLDVNGDAVANNWFVRSSSTYKGEIRRLKDQHYREMLSVFDRIDVASYRHKEEYGGADTSRRIGFLAEELPDEVLSPDGKAVDLYGLIAYAVGAMKALGAEKDALRRDLDAKSLEWQTRLLRQESEIQELRAGLRKLVPETEP